ncbi:Diguanylate phosphodiesterase [Frankia canadensis]|uniref:Diguanylate phosphodiesterase n=1 Tax=Frankia canadensis TaxID=1836972 RepID=A0A2I2KUK0_9ACTN|nr:EAL domain-containing protein [Frankia canadensis]SNQ49343.1 Diguanylate phosphodiesterase [Frankia canadensis]SOU56633.1 Diguanylate phosphodiesterase [Frankia canadensis]
MTVTTPLLGPPTDVPTPSPAVVELLGFLRGHLDQDLAWLGRLESDRLVMQVLVGDATSFHLRLGSTVLRDTSIYTRVLAGALPQLIPDTTANPHTSTLPMVRELRIGCYATVPVFDGENQLYGLLGCLSHRPHPDLRDRDGRFLAMMAEILRDSVTDLHRMWQVRSQVWHEVSQVIDRGGPDLVFQPVFDLARGRIVGVEALSRFPGGERDTTQWFAAAAAVGLTVELELAAIHRALAALPRIRPPRRLAVNASATTLSTGLVGALAGSDARRLLVEITEHERIDDAATVLRQLDELRRLGVQFAADDVGAGYAGLERLVQLRPEVIKMDCGLTRGIEADPARRAVAAALVHVADYIGSDVVAEGIETAGALRAAQEAGIRYGQGVLLAPPSATLPAAVTACGS